MKKLGYAITIFLCKLTDKQAGYLFTAIAALIIGLGIL
jgi:hypothetical protein